MQIVVSLTAETGTFVTDIDRATKGAEKAFKKLEADSKRFFNDLKKGPTDVGSQIVEVFDQMEIESAKSLEELHKKAKITLGAIAVAFGLAVRSAVNFTSEVTKSSQRVGENVEEYSKLAFAARKGGIDLQGLESIIIRISDSANESRDGISGAAAAYAALGVDVEDSNDKLKSGQELLIELVDALSKFESGPAKLSAIRDIAGPLGVTLISAFGGGAKAIEEATKQAEKFNSQITQESSQAVKAFNVGLHDITEAGEGLINKFLKESAPLLILIGEGFEHLADVAVQHLGPAISRLVDLFNLLGVAIVVVKNAGDTVFETFDGLGDAVDALIRGKFGKAFEELKGIGKDVEGNFQDILTAYDKLYNGVEDKPLLILGKAELDYDPRALQAAEEARRKAAQEAIKRAQELRRLQEAIAQGSAEIFQAEQDRERNILDASLDLRKISYKQFLDERLRLTEQAIDREIELSQGLIENAAEDEAVLLKARIEALEIRREIARDESAQDEARHVQEIADAYDEAARSARSYLDYITREGQRSLDLLSASPAQRRFAQGQFQIDDRFIADKERLDQERAQGLDQEAYDQQLTLLQNAHAAQSAEWDKYWSLLEEKQKDFTTSFNNSIQEYVDATSNVGQALGDTFVEAIDEAIRSTSRLAAEFILFGEGGKDAIYQLARSIATELLSALIRAGIQLAVNKALLSSFGGGGFGAFASAGGAIGFASGGYSGDIPRNKVAGVVHGQEFVVNPEATRENRALLEQINSGTFDAASNVPRSDSQGSGKSGMTQRIINVWDKSDIKDYLMGSEGEEVFINWAGRNGVRLRSIIQSA